MKYIILTTLIGLSTIATVAVPASADNSFKVHGYETNYGR